MLSENSFDFETGPRRILAAGVDFVVLFPLFVVDSMIWSSSLGPVMKWALLSSSAAFYAFYAPMGHALFGQTFGKRAAGVRVVDLRGERISWSRALLRDVVPLLVTLYWFYAYARDLHNMNIPSTPGFEVAKVDVWVQLAQSGWVIGELVTMFFNRRRRALHDFIAGTVVVRVHR